MAAAASRAPAAPPLAPRRRVAAPARPRRVSGPSRRPAPAAPPRRGAQGGIALGLIGVAGKLDALASHRLLDRLIRSRVWIGIVAFALIGIVTLQLGLLKLNSGIGRALESEASLQRENAALSVENSELAAGSRVESQAERLGMRLVSVGGLQFLSSHARSDLPHAASALQSAPAREAAASHAAASSEAGQAESGSEAGAESPSSEQPPASPSTGEASSTTSSATTSEQSAPAETTAPSAGTEATSQPSSEQVPAGVGGGAAAPGG